MTRCLLLLAIILLAAACRPAPVIDEPIPESPLLGPGIYQVSTGKALDIDELHGFLAPVRFVIVGETHTDIWHHEVQGKIYAALVKGSEGPVALGMEMFQQLFQDVLDAYVAGEIDEEGMLDATKWVDRWGFDAEPLSPMWRLARERGYPVVVLNIPRERVRRVGQVGVEGLDDDERALLPEMDLTNEAYREAMRQSFAHHGIEDEDRAESFYQAQVLWDEAMAERAVDFMNEHPHVEMMMIVAGRGHVERGWGIPSRIERRVDGEDEVVTIIPVTIDAPHQQDLRNLEYLQREEIADYVWVGRQTRFLD
ncbi:MAG: ChaN family lipoprotein [Bradymonadaceae bacterium]